MKSVLIKNPFSILTDPRHRAGKQQSRDILLFGQTCLKHQKFIVSMRVQEISEVCNERNCMHRSMRLLGKVHQLAIYASKSKQEGSNNRRILKQNVLALHSLSRKHG